MALDGNMVFLNHAAIAPLPKNTLKVMQETLASLAKFGSKGLDLQNLVATNHTLRANLANLINGRLEGIALTDSTTSGLHIIADGIQHEFQSGDNIVLTDQEFVNNSYVWQQLAERHNLDLRVVKSRDEKLLIEDWSEQIDNKTKLVAVSHVQFGNGFRSNLKPISKLAHDNDAYILVDAIQSTGIVPINVKQDNIDFLASGGSKWLLGPFGCGFLYVNPSLIENVKSMLVGAFSSSKSGAFKHNIFTSWPDARRYEKMIQVVSIPFNSSVELIIRWNVEKSYFYVQTLLDRIRSNLQETNSFQIVSDMTPKHRSGFIKIKYEKNLQNLVEHLLQNNIVVSLREEGVRVSPHAYNTKEDIDKLTETMIEFDNQIN